VITDVIGSFPWFLPPFATQRGEVAGEITKAVKAYLDDLSR
jgi:ketopantoate hydroxymethyltransferase